MNLKQFIKMANEVHDGIYDYSESIFTGVTHSLIVICPQCGPFRVTPNAHINCSVGCPQCKNEQLTYVLSAKEFDRIFNRNI